MVTGFCVQAAFGYSLPTISVYIVAGAVAYPFVVAAAGGVAREDVMIVNSLEERVELDLEPVKAVIRRFI